MKHPQRKTALALVLALSAGLTATALAHPPRGGMMGGTGSMFHGGMMPHAAMADGPHGYGMGLMGGMHAGFGMMRGIDLDDEQRTRLRELRSEHRKEQFARMAQLMDLRDEMLSLMATAQPDPDAVQNLHAQMADLHGEMLADQVRLRNAMRDVLTSEQRQRLGQRRSMREPMGGGYRMGDPSDMPRQGQGGMMGQ
ncbi:Spy/CpxP family protein refolding chaperone [Arhodomonas sp. AD133]|uniref:Spy/CpxP family protein refolding chaperone n=1 Tax=Arhodomonas sp. AD133 TaxID=3415009 RepID=UPI003EB92210